LSAWIVGGKPINDRVAAVLRSRGIGLDSEGKIIIPSRDEQPRSQQSPSPQRAAPAAPIPTNAISSAASQQQGSMARPFSVTTEEDFNNVPSGAFYRDETTGRLAQKP
jgi:hypothetical protein